MPCLAYNNVKFCFLHWPNQSSLTSQLSDGQFGTPLKGHNLTTGEPRDHTIQAKTSSMLWGTCIEFFTTLILNKIWVVEGQIRAYWLQCFRCLGFYFATLKKLVPFLKSSLMLLSVVDGDQLWPTLTTILGTNALWLITLRVLVLCWEKLFYSTIKLCLFYLEIINYDLW